MSIATGDVIEGNLPTSRLRAVQSWLDEHCGQVSFYWGEMRKGRSIEGMIK